MHALPDIQGTGQVRDLREAASLSAELAATAAGINGSLSPAQMRAQVDALLGQWADTSEMQGGIEQAATRNVRRMKSRHWRYGEKICYDPAGNDAVIEMTRAG